MQFFGPDRLEADLGAELVDLGECFFAQRHIAGDDRHRNALALGALAQPVEKPESVHERHAEVEDDRVGVEVFGFAQAVLRVHRGADLVTFEPQNPGESLRDAFVIVDDQ